MRRYIFSTDELQEQVLKKIFLNLKRFVAMRSCYCHSSYTCMIKHYHTGHCSSTPKINLVEDWSLSTIVTSTIVRHEPKCVEHSFSLKWFVECVSKYRYARITCQWMTIVLLTSNTHLYFNSSTILDDESTHHIQHHLRFHADLDLASCFMRQNNCINGILEMQSQSLLFPSRLHRSNSYHTYATFIVLFWNTITTCGSSFLSAVHGDPIIQTWW